MNDQDPINVLGLAGSLREGSLNRKLLRAAQTLAPEGIRFEVHDLKDIPLYNGDIDGETRPAPVTAFKQAIAQADALLIATPEYNYGISGVLKNALDWASRPGFKSVLVRKPTAIIGASPGLIGTARAQAQLKITLLSTLACVLPHPEITVGTAQDKFDTHGHLIDPATRDRLITMLTQLAEFARALKGWRA